MICRECGANTSDFCIRCWAKANGWRFDEEKQLLYPTPPDPQEQLYNAVKALREKTGAGLQECKNAYVYMGRDPQLAELYLRNRGQAIARKRVADLSIPSYGERITIGEFIQRVREGYLTDYDGFGKYATSEYMSDISILPSMVRNSPEELKTWYSHIVWFNR